MLVSNACMHLNVKYQQMETICTPEKIHYVNIYAISRHYVILSIPIQKWKREIHMKT